MCGIAGAFDTAGRRVPDRDLLRRMNLAQAHRGPDDDTVLIEPGLALGSRRLAVIDLRGGRQPAFDQSRRLAVVFNGEIYNFRELRQELSQAGLAFRTEGDTEVIANGWSRWGAECLDRLTGMFAFAMYDKERDLLVLARDRLGEKPLYYTVAPDGWLYFASELKALLLTPGFDRAFDLEAVESYFALGYIPDPLCIFRSVRKLPPAHALHLRRGCAPQMRAYWDVQATQSGEGTDEKSAEELVERLRSAVQARLISDVPIGAFLSGGIDSSAVVAFMQPSIPGRVETCSIGFREASHDERRFAELAATRFDTSHSKEEIGPDPQLLETLPKVYDEPFADSSALPTYALSRLARRRVTVALSGDGGDEIFAGYRRYRFHVNEERIRQLVPRPVRRSAFGFLAMLYPKLDWAPRPLRAKTTLQALASDSIEAYFQSVSIIPEPLRRRVFSGALREELGGYRAVEILRDHAGRAPRRDPLSLAQYVDLKTYLPGDILVKVDRASMAHGLEVRVPLLDHTLVEWAFGLSADLKLRGGESKYILKRALRGRVPPEILERRKMGFSIPLASWLRGPLRERLEDGLGSRRLRWSGLFDPDMLRRLIAEHASGRNDHSAALWSLMMFDGFLGTLEPAAGATMQAPLPA